MGTLVLENTSILLRVIFGSTGFPLTSGKTQHYTSYTDSLHALPVGHDPKLVTPISSHQNHTVYCRNSVRRTGRHCASREACGDF